MEEQNESKEQNKKNPVLIVEDDKENAKLLEIITQNNNLSTIKVFNGEEAIREYRKNNISIILLDIQLPVMNGVEVIRNIRKIEENSNKFTPIIVITAYAGDNYREEFLNEGADEYMYKPINLKKLEEVIKKYK